MTDKPLLEVKDLTLTFRLPQGRSLTAVDGVSFSLQAGETLGLVGESGCGKTSLAKALLRLYKPTSGNISVDGENWLEASTRRTLEIRRQIQMVFQDPYASLDPRQTIGSAVMEPMLVSGLYRTKRDAEKRCAFLLDRCGLSPNQMWKFPHEFSGGQLQRVGIARALAMSPKIIIADEPVSALDVSIRAQILNLFKELQREMNLALLFISHDLALVRYMSHRVAVMYLGKLVECAEAETLCSKPAHPYTQMLIDSIPHPNPETNMTLKRSVHTDLPSPLNIPTGCPFHTRCPYVKDICKTTSPQLHSLGHRGEVSCHDPR